jgi:hypothetical protein
MVVVPEIPVVIAIPSVIVLNASVIAFPVPFEKALPVVIRPDPVSALIRWAGPISIMPAITVPPWIIVAIDPNETGSRYRRPHSNHTWGRRWANPHANRYLGEHTTSRQEKQRN